MAASLANESLTRSVEDYLKAIYHLSSHGEPAGTNDIAHLLALSPPSVSGMIKRLAEQGLLSHAPYRGSELTDEGRRLALRMVRRHRLLEAYLVEFLGYDWDTVHEAKQRRGEVAQLKRENARLRARRATLREPSALEREARRLGMVRPGERPYVLEHLPKGP